jgi:hypothetical protein
MATTTSQSASAKGYAVKFGKNHAVSQGSVNHELQIVKSLLSELNSGVTDAIDKYSDYTSTSKDNNNPNVSQYFASDFDKNNIQILLNNSESYRSHAITASYVSNPDNTGPGDSSDNVVINATTNAIVLSEVLDDSSAYANATAKITLSDPYYTNSDPSYSIVFTDSDASYNGYFDKTNISNFLTTRNVNSNSAHNNGQGTISVAENTSWNTRDASFGCFFVNGTVSFSNDERKEPMATNYASNNVANILNQSLYKYAISLNPVNSTDEPIFGRYQLSYVNQNTVDVSYNNISSTPYKDFNMKYVTDPSYATFITNINNELTESALPSSVTVTGLDAWLPENIGAYADGFLFKIESNSYNAELVQTNTTSSNGNNIPFDFSLNNMEFAAKNMYILEQSMTNPSGGSAILAPSITVQGTTYNNQLVVTNGGLSLPTLNDVNSGYIELLDGFEDLSLNTYNTNGLISVYNSSKLSIYGDNTNYPRATGLEQSSTSGILSNFVVQYSSDSSNNVDVGVIDALDLLGDISYNISCLVGQTTTNDSSGNWDNLIGYNSGAVAVVKDSNPYITPTSIAFIENTSAFNGSNNNMTVIDIACNKLWSESKVYDSGDAQIPGIVADIVTTNTDSASFNLKDIRLKMTAKELSDLSLSPSNNQWSLSCPDSYLMSSTGKMGFIGDSSIVDYLLGSDSDTTLLSNTLSVRFEATSTSIQVHKFTKFRTQIVTSYVVNGVTYTQTTYDDEFDATTSGISFNTDLLIDTTGYLGMPLASKLYKRSYNQNVSVKIPLRLGNYNNIFITTPSVLQTVEYYILTDDNNNGAELPRSSLKDVRTNANQPLNASFTMTASTTDITFSKNTFKTHKYTLEKKINTSWDNVALSDVYHTDLWYNTKTIIPSPLGTFTVTQTISPTLANMNQHYLYIDMELEKTKNSFTISGKNIAPENINNIGNINFSTYDFTQTPDGIEALELGDVTYTRDSDAAPNTQSITTLMAAGFKFQIIGELYLNIRVIVCPNGIFKCVKTSTNQNTTTIYKNIQTIDTNSSLKLQNGIYAYGGLLSAKSSVSYATWKLNNDAIKVNYYGSYYDTTYGTGYARITSLNQVFRPFANWRGFKTNIVRGFTPNLDISLNRTPSKYLFQLAGYEASGNIYSGMSLTPFGGINMTLNNILGRSIFTSSTYGSIGDNQLWNFRTGYGSYTITNRADIDSSFNTSSVNSFNFLLADRKEVNVVSTSLNTKSGFYSIGYNDTSSLTVRRNSNITADNYNVLPGGYQSVVESTFSTAQLRNATRRNLIGNILDIHFTTGELIPDMSLCHFSICPPYLLFSAIDPSGVSTIPFDSASQPLVTRYVGVNNANIYIPFSGHATINNMKFAKASTKYYLQYFTNSESVTKKLNVKNYDISIYLANGLASASTIGTYQTFYGPATIDASSNANVDLSLNSTALTIGINQQQLDLLSGFTIYDASYTEYNLQLKIGSIFISKLINTYNGTKDIILEFTAGDCTKLTQYGIESIDVNSNADTLDVVVSRHTCATGISNNFLNKSSQGLSIPWTSKDTMTLSTSLNSSDALTSTTRGINTFLNNLRTSITSLPGWNVVNSPSSTLPKMALIPHNTTGQKSLRQFLTTSKNIPLSTAILELQDHVRITDSYGVPINRITYGGALQGHVLSLNSTVIREKFGSEPTTYLVDKINSGLPTTHSF